jgi:hypothetical protein
MESSSTVLSDGSNQDHRRRRRRRQALTFTGLLLLVLLTAVGALGNWLQWWTLGSAQAAPAPCPVQTVSAARQTPVNVYNGTDRRGLAGAVARELQRRDFRVLAIGNEQHPARMTTAVAVRYGPGDEVRARTVALQFPGRVTLTANRRARADHSVDVVIGGLYQAMQLRTAAAAAIAPLPTPRNCRPVTPSSGAGPTAGT